MNEDETIEDCAPIFFDLVSGEQVEFASFSSWVDTPIRVAPHPFGGDLSSKFNYICRAIDELAPLTTTAQWILDNVLIVDTENDTTQVLKPAVWDSDK